MVTELKMVGEGRAEMHLVNACPTCDGAVELRLSSDGARTFCATCHVIRRPDVQRDPHTGLSLHYRDLALA
jgi:hypothetical protein